jgi:DNA-binding NtrC family response regulator
MDSLGEKETGENVGQLGAGGGEESMDLRARVRRYEVQLILSALEVTGGNQTQAARLLKIPLRTLAYKIKTLGIMRPGYTAPSP